MSDEDNLGTSLNQGESSYMVASEGHTLTRRLAEFLQKRADKSQVKRDARLERARDKAARKRLLRDSKDDSNGHDDSAVSISPESIELDRLRVKPVHYVFLVAWVVIAFFGSRLVYVSLDYQVSFFSDFSILIIFASTMLMFFCFRSARSHSKSFDTNIVSVFEYMLRRGKTRFSYRSIYDPSEYATRSAVELRSIVDMPAGPSETPETNVQDHAGNDSQSDSIVSSENRQDSTIAPDSEPKPKPDHAESADVVSADSDDTESNGNMFGSGPIDDANAAEMLKAYKMRTGVATDDGGEYSKPFYAQVVKERSASSEAKADAEAEAKTARNVTSSPSPSKETKKTVAHERFGSPAIVVTPAITFANKNRSYMKNPKRTLIPVHEIDQVVIGNQSESFRSESYLEKNEKIREMMISDRSQLIAFVSAYIFGALAASGLAFII